MNQELKELAIKLETIARYEESKICNSTPFTELLLTSSKWLHQAAIFTCRQGFVGCRGGDNCTSDHK